MILLLFLLVLPAFGSSEERFSQPELCSLVVTGRAPGGSVTLPWHEAVLSGFRLPFGGTLAPPMDESELEPARAPTPPLPLETVPPAEEGRALLLAGRHEEAWWILRDLAPEPGGGVAFLRAWAAFKSGAGEALELLRPFTARDAPSACRLPASRAAARLLAAEGRLREGLSLLETIREELPEIPEYTLLWSLEARAQANDAAGVDSLFHALSALAPSVSVLRSAELARAGALERIGDLVRARALLAGVLSRTPRRERPALLRRLADLALSLGEAPAADAQLRQLVDRHPDSNEALELVELGTRGGRPPIWLSARDRAVVLAAHGRWRGAVEELVPTSDPQLLRLRGDIHLRHGEFPAAAADYAEAIARGGDRDELRRELAKAYGRAGEPAQARAVYLELYHEAEGRRQTTAGRATLVYLIADAFQDEAAFTPAFADSAAEWFRLLVERYPGAQLAPRGLLRHAHLRFARGGWGEAEALYREYLRKYAGREDAREARYWLGRAVYESGRTEEGRALLAELLGFGAADYYAVLARRRLGGAPQAAIDALFGRRTSRSGAAAAVEPAEGSGGERGAAEGSVADTLLPVGGPGERALRRARALLLAGEVEAAQEEVDEAVRLSGRSRTELERVARWALAWGYPESAFRIGAALASSPGAGSPLDPSWTEAERLAFPRAFAEHVSVEARETGLPTALLWAIMRQESRFDPAVRSPAGAVGLLQLLPSTAREEAAQARVMSFDIRDLERPEANLHLGVLHLRRLLDVLAGERVAVLAAYNAGLGLANRWLGLPEARNPEGYVERIPFRETRNYVKQVIANQARYEELYVAP